MHQQAYMIRKGWSFIKPISCIHTLNQTEILPQSVQMMKINGHEHVLFGFDLTKQFSTFLHLLLVLFLFPYPMSSR